MLWWYCCVNIVDVENNKFYLICLYLALSNSMQNACTILHNHVLCLDLPHFSTSSRSTTFLHIISIYHISPHNLDLPHFSTSSRSTTFHHIISIYHISPHNLDLPYFSTLSRSTTFYHIISIYHIFPHYLTNNTIFNKEIFKHKVTFLTLSTNSLGKLSFSKKNLPRSCLIFMFKYM